jgi:hypothetical protein
MAKIFYTIEEACAKLGKSEADLLALIKSGKLREFRDQDQLKLKVEDVTSLSDSGLDMGSKLKDLSDGSGSFELDLSDSMSPELAQDPKGSSPVGPTAPPAIEDDLALDLGSMASGETPAAAEQSSAGDDAFTFELDLDDSPSSTPPAKSAAPVVAKIEIDDDAMTLELDLGDSQPAAPTPAKTKTAPKVAAAAITDDLSFEDDLGADLAQSAVAPAANKFDQTTEDARDGSAMDFDSRVDSALGGSAGLDADTMNLDQPGSGSGLLDLTQESDDSQMGAALMESTFEGDDEAPKNASGIFGGAASESGINEAVVGGGGLGSAAPAFAGAAMAGSEIYSGSWSGLTIGLLVPTIVGLSATAAMLVIKTLGGTPDLAVMFSSDWIMWTGGYAGAIAVCGGIGFFVGKATE